MPQPTRILHVIDSLGRRGGAERQLALEVGVLDRERFANHVCYLRPPDYLEPLFNSMGVPVYRLDVHGKGQWPSGIRKLRRLVKTLDIDLIHTSLYDADIVGGVAGRLAGVPVVSTLTNSAYEPVWLIDNPHVNRYKLAFSRLTRALVARYCDRHVVAVSESVKSSAVRQLRIPEEKISVIYRALSTQWLAGNSTNTGNSTNNGSELNHCDNVPEGFPVLINTGRLEPQKGQRYIIQAMPRILRRFPKAALVILGEGSLQAQLLKLAQDLEVDDRVFFLGQRTDVKELLAASDIFVFPSLYEGCPNALIEAMVMGLPSVAFDIEPVAEVTHEGKHGILVPPQDSSAMAEAVIDLAVQPEKAKGLGQRAREMAKREFSLETVVIQRSAAYENCVGLVRK
jgi:glycosyltransferase involved in cell wall biosynthesis